MPAERKHDQEAAHGDIEASYSKDYQRDLAQKVEDVAPAFTEAIGPSIEHLPKPLRARDLPSLNVDFHKSAATQNQYFKCIYPTLPHDTDFETYRKTFKSWKDIVTVHNRPFLEGKTSSQKKKIYRERFITFSWPRGKGGKWMIDVPDGKHTNNGVEIWGATLLDFYIVYRGPNVVIHTSGSRIAAWMKAEGGDEPNNEPGRTYMLQAASEPDPRILDVYNVGLFLEMLEDRVSRGRLGRALYRPASPAGSAQVPMRDTWPVLTSEQVLELKQAVPGFETLDQVACTLENVLILQQELRARGMVGQIGGGQEILKLYKGNMLELSKDLAQARIREEHRERERESAIKRARAKTVGAETKAVDADADMEDLNDRIKKEGLANNDKESLQDHDMGDAEKDPVGHVETKPEPRDQDVKMEAVEEGKKAEADDGERMDVEAEEVVGANAETEKKEVSDMEVDESINEKNDADDKNDKGKGKAKVEELSSADKELFEDWFKERLVYQKRFENADTPALFPLDRYPEPWPLRPFSAPLPRLQCQFNHAYLPRKLFVHDPWGITEVSSSNARRLRDMDAAAKCKWGTEPDSVQIFDLSPDPLLESYQAFDAAGGDGKRAVPEAHLYLSPKRRIGSGHHSFVYQAELELPRGMLVPPRMCKSCAEALWRRAVYELHTMSPEETVREYAWPHDIATERLYSALFKKRLPFDSATDKPDQRFRVLKRMRLATLPAFCPHLRKLHPAPPPSHRVSVTVKLSVPNDKDEKHEKHLLKEARNYERFPTSMYEHWTGYNIIHPSRDPTPVGAVCPQFYGYYNPSPQNRAKRNGDFQSAILILEHCGLQINAADLSADDKTECLSLIRRLHYASYMHNSLYERNIVIQNGPLTVPPWKRSALHRRFRLIDYGRTDKIVNGFKECTDELYSVLNALDLPHPQMGSEV